MERNAETGLSRKKTYLLAAAALMTALTCILAPLSIPIGPVPIALTNLVIYLSLYLLGGKWGTASCLAYLLLGTAGLPVFAGFTGGLGILMGNTGGYLAGFIPMAVIAGWAIDHSARKGVQLLGMLAGTAVCYALGTAWFCFVGNTHPLAALGACGIPFIPFDLGKMVLAMAVGSLIRRQLDKAGLSPAQN